MDKETPTNSSVWTWTQRVAAILAIALALIAFYQWLTSFIEPWKIWFSVSAVSLSFSLWLRGQRRDAEAKEREDLARAIDEVNVMNKLCFLLLYLRLLRERPDIEDRLLASIPNDSTSRKMIQDLIDDARNTWQDRPG